ncbi:MAG: ECF transporter S component [Candidatus Paceibacterota bacterium]|jgi:uncharacterized membrane protein
METKQKNYFKYFAGFIFVLFLRLIPLRAPNVEMILATQMPFSRVYGKFLAFSFGFFSIIFYDLITSTLGVWSLVTSFTYGFIGLWAVSYFNKKSDNKSFTYVKFAIMSTIVYDAVTGLIVGPMIFHQQFSVALAGQIPFTIIHLLGNTIFASMLSPAIYNFLIRKRSSENKIFTNIFKPKTI